MERSATRRRVWIPAFAGMTVAAQLCLAASPPLTPQRGQLACGGTIVTALAHCHGDTPLCARESLSFRRTEGGTFVAPHKRLAAQALPDGGSVQALEYRLSEWACVPGVNGGRYVAVILTRTRGGSCADCEYTRLYHPNGRLIAATLAFDANGRSRESPGARELVAEMIGRDRIPFRPIYGK